MASANPDANEPWNDENLHSAFRALVNGHGLGAMKRFDPAKLTEAEQQGSLELFQHLHPDFTLEPRPRKKRPGRPKGQGSTQRDSEKTPTLWHVIHDRTTLDEDAQLFHELGSHTGNDYTADLPFLEPLNMISINIKTERRAAAALFNQFFISLLAWRISDKNKTSLSRTLYIFSQLQLGDLAARVFDLKDDHSVNSKRFSVYKARLSKLWNNCSERKRSNILHVFLAQREAKEDFTERLRKAINRGLKLRHLCNDHGTGTILFFQKRLTDPFLNGGYCTLTGRQYEAIGTKLQELGYAQKVDEFRANVTGDAIRAFFGRHCDLTWPKSRKGKTGTIFESSDEDADDSNLEDSSQDDDDQDDSDQEGSD